MTNNQFLDKRIKTFDIDFNSIKKEEIISAYEKLFTDSRNEFNKLLETESASYTDLFKSGSYEQLMSIHHLISSMSSLLGSEMYREIDDLYSPKIASLSQEFSMNKNMFNKIVSLRNSPEFDQLNDIRKKKIDKIIKNLKDSGVDLPESQKKKLNSLIKKQSLLVNKFQNNINDSQSKLQVKVSKSQLSDLSDIIIDKIVKLNNQIYSNNNLNCLILDEQTGTMNDVMKYCSNEKIREKIYNKKKKMCRTGAFNNTNIIDKIYKNSQKIAKVLGYNNYASMNLVDNMAKTPNNVIDFLNNIGNSAIDIAKDEIKMVNDYCLELYGKKAKWWDYEFLCDKLLKRNFSLDSELVKSYLKVENVISGLFKILGLLFKLSFVKNESESLWHKDVISYSVYEDGEYIGKILMDLYKRKGKSPGAWLDPISYYEDNDLNKSFPVALLVCNINKSTEFNQTMEFDDVVTLFHEMGHAIHLLMSKVSEEFYSGFNNVEHDAVEIPSQFLENFAYNRDVLNIISEHVETKEKMPTDLVDSIIKSKKFLSASFLINMVRYSEMDVMLYMQDERHPFEFEEYVMKKWKISDNPDFDRKRMPIFSHIFGGGYSSGYYAYQWADVYAVDAYSYVMEDGLLSEKTLKRAIDYKNNLLYKGGSESMNELYNSFRGSNPSIENYLRFYL